MLEDIGGLVLEVVCLKIKVPSARMWTFLSHCEIRVVVAHAVEWQ